MKNIIVMLMAGTVLLVSSCSQDSGREKIEVIGSAEMEVTPDIVYVGISLREYFVSGTTVRVSIEIMEDKLKSVLKSAGIDVNNLVVNNVASYQEHYNRKRDPQYLAAKQYRLKLPDVKKLDAILAALDPQGIQYTQVEGYEYSNLDTIRKNLKIKALKAAQNKAYYLTEAIDKELGEAIEVSEITEPMQMNRQMNAGNGAMSEAVEQSAASTVNFKSVKLSSQIRVVFEME